MKKVLMAAAAAAAFSVSAQCRDSSPTYLESVFPQGIYTTILQGKYSRQLYPPFTNRKAWTAPFSCSPEKQSFSKSVLEKAQVILNEEIPMLHTTDYTAFQQTGTRVLYECGYFRRRGNLGILVTALGITGDRETYLPKIVDYLGAICEESFWCIHAHAHYQDDDCYPVVSVTRRRVDLFSAETGALIALTLNICGDALNDYSRNFTAQVRQTVLERTLRPFLDPAMDEYHWWLAGQSNWSVWICDNLLTTATILLDDPAEYLAVVKKTVHTAGLYLQNASDTGYCNEGPSYWLKSCGELMLYCNRLNTLFPGALSKLYEWEKFRNVMEFPAKAAYNRNYMVNFGDACSQITYPPMQLYFAGAATDSQLLKDFAAYQYSRWMKQNEQPLKPFVTLKKVRAHMNTGDNLRTGLYLLFDLPDELHASTEFTTRPAVIFKDKLAICRSQESCPYIATLKAGDNNENHNHNDLGHFTLFRGNEPLIIDLGTIVYIQQSFTERRYEMLWYSAIGHNAPIFAGTMQQAGEEYKATLALTHPAEGQTRLICNLSQAYPAEAGIRSLIRTVDIGRGQCVLTDKAELASPMPVELNFYTPAKAELVKQAIHLGKNTEMVLPKGAKAEITPFPCDDVNICKSWGHNTLSKITITIPAQSYSILFRNR